MRDVDPFSMMLEAPYGIDLLRMIGDMIDQTIGVIASRVDSSSGAPSKLAVQRDLKRDYAFVAMPMTPTDDALIDVLEAIKEAAARCGIVAERIDEVESNERITDRILESIDHAEFIVVDLTGSKPNVFFEAGYAHGLGKLPIYVARFGTELHFDLKDYPVIFFRNMKELKDRLEHRFRALTERRGKSR